MSLALRVPTIFFAAARARSSLLTKMTRLQRLPAKRSALITSHRFSAGERWEK